MKTVKYTEAEARQNPHGIDARKLYDSDYAI